VQDGRQTMDLSRRVAIDNPATVPRGWVGSWARVTKTLVIDTPVPADQLPARHVVCVARHSIPTAELNMMCGPLPPHADHCLAPVRNPRRGTRHVVAKVPRRVSRPARDPAAASL